MAPTSRYAGALAYALLGSSACASSFPSLSLIRETMLTTAGVDFDADQGIAASSKWTLDRLGAGDDEGPAKAAAPHIACVESGRRREAVSSLEESLGPGTVRPISSTRAHGACFIVTASHAQAKAVSGDLDTTCFAAFPSALKLAPGLLEHSDCSSNGDSDCSTERLSTTHGASMRLDSVYGLMVELSPGTSDFDIAKLTQDLNSPSLDLHETSFWSDAGMQGGEHLASAGGALRGREWRRAATVVHELSESGETSPSDICSWGDLEVHRSASDVLLVSGKRAFFRFSLATDIAAVALGTGDLLLSPLAADVYTFPCGHFFNPSWLLRSFKRTRPSRPAISCKSRRAKNL